VLAMALKGDLDGDRNRGTNLFPQFPHAAVPCARPQSHRVARMDPQRCLVNATMRLKTANSSDLRVIDQDGAIVSRRASERSLRFVAHIPFSVQND
ncbi:MAG: hypothetical protein Q9212_007397, partial [Teloschistes hypoglaucus]